MNEDDLSQAAEQNMTGHYCPGNSLSLRDACRDAGGRAKQEPEPRGLG